MSHGVEPGPTGRRYGVRGGERARQLALLAALTVMATFLSVFYHVTAVLGGRAWLVAYVGGAVVCATVLARRYPLTVEVAAGLALVLFAAGMGGYLLLLPEAYYALFSVERMIADVWALLTGRSVILLLKADLWAVGLAPAPAFLTWYLALREQYGPAALVGGGTLAFFSLTGDASNAVTLVGMLGTLGLLGFGAVDRWDGDVSQLRDLGLVLALVVLITRTIGVVPDGARGAAGGGGEGGQPALETSLLSTDDTVDIRGSVSLSPERRFRIRADEVAYWHVAAYDRYTGGGWRREDGSRPYTGQLSSPPGEHERLHQEVTVLSPVGTMPAAWKPVLVGPAATEYTRVSAEADLLPAREFTAGDSYTVVSQVPEWSEASLRDAGTDYPSEIRERYRTLPDSMPDRVADTTDDIVAAADATTPYEVAVAVQAWLKENKGYSLSVGERDWDTADAFVHEMDEGYCVYFATAMAVMLRTQGVPARFVVGYAPGDPGGEGVRIVRGLHSHAWVEVFFPSIGWITFDPTPGGPRDRVRRRRIEESRAAAESGETGGTGAESTPTPTPTETPTPTDAGTTDGSPVGDSAPNQSSPVQPQPDGRLGNETGDGSPTPPPAVAGGDGAATPTGTPEGSGRTGGTIAGRDRLTVLGGVVGVLLGAHRLKLLEAGFYRVWERYQPRTGSPEADVRRAYGRLEHYLGRHYRERDPAETPAQYLDGLESEGARVSPRMRRVADIYERAHYAGEVDERAADRAVTLVDEIVRK